MVNCFVAYELDICSRDLNTDFALGEYLFGAVKLARKATPNKYGNSGYGIGFDARSQFTLPVGKWRKNVGVDNSSPRYTDNRKKIP